MLHKTFQQKQANLAGGAWGCLSYSSTDRKRSPFPPPAIEIHIIEHIFFTPGPTVTTPYFVKLRQFGVPTST